MSAGPGSVARRWQACPFTARSRLARRPAPAMIIPTEEPHGTT
jgi:hypothetical protein